MNKSMITAALVATLYAAPSQAGSRYACAPINVADVAGIEHEVEVEASDCAEVSLFIRGYAQRNRIVADRLSRVVVSQFGRGGDVQVFSVGSAQTGVVHRGGGSTDIDNTDGAVSVENDGGNVSLKNVGNNTIRFNISRR